VKEEIRAIGILTSRVLMGESPRAARLREVSRIVRMLAVSRIARMLAVSRIARMLAVESRVAERRAKRHLLVTDRSARGLLASQVHLMRSRIHRIALRKFRVKCVERCKLKLREDSTILACKA
jgi:hypothetical protein